MQILLGKKKRFYKANLHCHSTESDGNLSPKELKEEYKKRGYSIVAFTDHEHVIDNSYLNDDDFLTITSCELSIKENPHESTRNNFDMRVCHMNFYALDANNLTTPCYSSKYDHFINENNKDKIVFEEEYDREYGADSINEMIKIANKKGFIVSYNHPNWSLENAADYLKYDGLFAVEIYNHGCAILGHNDDEHAFDDMLRAGKHIFCTATDDNHNKAEFESSNNDSFGGWVEIDADKLEYSEIMSALQAGDFYASTGAKIYSLTRDKDKLQIRTSPSKRISMLTRGRRTESIAAESGLSLTFAEFTVRETDGYFRFRIEDENGKKAYTQAYTV